MLAGFVALTSALLLPTAPVSRVARCNSPVMGTKKRDSMEESRRLNALITGTNWPPRTPPTPGKGYFFFQGPTPKTSFQKDLPSFFSAENFADVAVKPVQLIVTATGFTSLVLILAGLNGAFDFNPAAVAPPKPKAPDTSKADKEAKAKADAEAKAKKEAEAKAAKDAAAAEKA